MACDSASRVTQTVPQLATKDCFNEANTDDSVIGSLETLDDVKSPLFSAREENNSYEERESIVGKGAASIIGEGKTTVGVATLVFCPNFDPAPNLLTGAGAGVGAFAGTATAFFKQRRGNSDKAFASTGACFSDPVGRMRKSTD